MKQFRFYIASLFCLLWISSCNDDPQKEPTFVPTASNLVANDVSNSGTASDILLTFDKATDESIISEYRIVIVNLDFEGIFDVNLANSLDESRYQIVQTSLGSPIRLDPEIKTVNNESIKDQNTYLIYVLSVSNDTETNQNKLSAPSNAIKISEESDPAKNLKISDTGNKENSSDFQLSFSKAFDESKVSSYRAMIIKADKADEFTLKEAESLNENQYYVIIPSGIDHIVSLNPFILDSEADPIINNQSYRVKILSVQDGTNALKNILSNPSNELILEHISYVKTLSGELQASGGLFYHPEAYLIAGNTAGSFDNRQGNGISKISLEGEIYPLSTDLKNCMGGVLNPSNSSTMQTSQAGIFEINNDGISTLYRDQFNVLVTGSLTPSPALTYPTDIKYTRGVYLVSDCHRSQFYRLYVSNDGEEINELISYRDTLNYINCPRYIELNNSGELIVMNAKSNSLYKIPDPFSITFTYPETFVTLRPNEFFNSIKHDPLSNMTYATTSQNRLISIDNNTTIVTEIVASESKNMTDGSLQEASFIDPINIALAPNGKTLFVLDQVDPTNGLTVLRKIEITE